MLGEFSVHGSHEKPTLSLSRQVSGVWDHFSASFQSVLQPWVVWWVIDEIFQVVQGQLVCFVLFVSFSLDYCPGILFFHHYFPCVILSTVAGFILLAFRITADGDCNHEIKRCLFLGKKVVTNLDSILKSRDITLLTKVHVIKAMVFPVVMYGCEGCTINKAEHWRIDAFEQWCCRRLLRVPWTARRSNQSILKEISPE